MMVCTTLHLSNRLLLFCLCCFGAAITVGFSRTVDSVVENAGSIEILVEVKNPSMLQRTVVVNYNTPSSPQNTATRKFLSCNTENNNCLQGYVIIFEVIYYKALSY